MANLGNKIAFPLSRTVTWREKPGRGPLVNKVPNMKPSYAMQRDVVPQNVAQPGDSPTRKTNSSGAPTR